MQRSLAGSPTESGQRPQRRGAPRSSGALSPRSFVTNKRYPCRRPLNKWAPCRWSLKPGPVGRFGPKRIPTLAQRGPGIVQRLLAWSLGTLKHTGSEPPGHPIWQTDMRQLEQVARLNIVQLKSGSRTERADPNESPHRTREPQLALHTLSHGLGHLPWPCTEPRQSDGAEPVGPLLPHRKPSGGARPIRRLVLNDPRPAPVQTGQADGAESRCLASGSPRTLQLALALPSGSGPAPEQIRAVPGKDHAAVLTETENPIHPETNLAAPWVPQSWPVLPSTAHLGLSCRGEKEGRTTGPSWLALGVPLNSPRTDLGGRQPKTDHWKHQP